MKIVRFLRNGEPTYGCIEGDAVHTLMGDVVTAPECGERFAALSEVRLLAPCTPSKIVAVGLNYRSHAEEMGVPLPQEPVLFLKPPSAVVGPGDDVVYPRMAQRVDYEAELAVVIGRRAKAVSSTEAGGFIWGYTCGNDVTARDLQKKDGQWTRSKGFDTFCPLGPWIVTGLPDPNRVNLSCRVNGQTRQTGNTSDLIFDVAALVSFISHVMTLEPGDVVMTGTPAGISPVQTGDEMEIEIEGIGVLKNRVV